MSEDLQDNEAAYRRLKESIKQSYPPGWFVGVAQNQMVGAAAAFSDLERELRQKGFDPRDVLIVQAGTEYPAELTILHGRPRS